MLYPRLYCKGAGTLIRISSASTLFFFCSRTVFLILIPLNYNRSSYIWYTYKENIYARN
jgi:hypothetical protein